MENNNENQQDQNVNEMINIDNIHIINNFEGTNYSSKYTKITISFIIIFILKISFYFFFHKNDNSHKFYFHYYLIIYYNQYYRNITRYLLNYGFCHLVIELIITYNLCYYLENMLGTIITICAIFLSLIMISITNLIFIGLCNNAYTIFHYLNISEMFPEGGMTPLFFGLYTFYVLFELNSNKICLLFYNLIIKIRYSEFLILLILVFFTPNNSFIGNISGIIWGHVLYYCKNIFIPQKFWIKSFEHKFKLKRLFPLYRFINEKNPLMKHSMAEFNSKFFNCSTEISNNQHMIEFTLLNSENENDE